MRINTNKIIYKKLSYKIIGVLFEVYNELGNGYQEKIIEKAVAIKFNKDNISYKRQLKVDLKIEDKKIAEQYLDFLVEDKIILELKVCNRFYTRHVRQVLGYLNSYNKKLGIVALFTSTGVRYKRVINAKKEIRINS